MPKSTKPLEMKPLELDGSAMSPLAQVHLAKYQRWLKERMSDIATIPLIVLVWGPGKSGGELYKKRCQIRDLLRDEGDAALFSEELDEVCAGFACSERAKELIQAHGADFIVVLYSSPGSIAETHDFGGFLDILGSKMLVCVDSRYVDGYGYNGLLKELDRRFKNVHKYTWPEDIRDCHLLDAIHEKLVTLRVGKWWAVQLGKV